MIKLTKGRELNSRKENQVYDEVEKEKGMKIVSKKFIIKEKKGG